MGKIDKNELILILIIIFLGIFIFLNLFKNDEVTFIDGYDYLYEKAVDHLLKNDNNIDKSKDNYKMFIAYKGFGIAEDNKNIYAYMWVVSEAYYTEDNKLIRGSSNSMPYKFIFKKQNKRLVRYEITEEGNQYSISIKNMFPKSIQDEIINYECDLSLHDEIDYYYKHILNK